ncbi:MAG: cupin domain-containing protein [Actinomycetota bacterium]|nr:cupin domain-containing protein [Actinomycetota bacterium]
MNRINLAKGEFDYPEDDPQGFMGGMIRPGPDFAATKTGASFYELPPGQALCPYHYEWGEEEWLLVTEGSPTLRDPEGEHRLEPMDLVFFPLGPAGAHRVQNDSAEPVRFLMFSNIVVPTATVYPDSDKIGIWTDSERTDSLLARRTAGLDYYDGEV